MSFIEHAERDMELLEAAKLALKALHKLHGASMNSGGIAAPAIEALEAAIANQEQPLA